MLTSLESDLDRLSALYRYGILDCGHDAFLHAVVQKVAAAFGGMAAQIVMVDDHRLWIAASAGEPLDERGKQGSIAAAAIQQIEPLIIADLHRDGRFAHSPSVLDAPRLRAYAGFPLRTADGHVIGVLAVSDRDARAFEPEHMALLHRARARIMERLEAFRVVRLDPASGALSRAAFRAQVSSLAAFSNRHRHDLSLLAVEIGALRSLLQSFQADLGQLVVDRMSGLGLNSVRRLDIFGRLDESTFAVLLPNTDEAGARILGRRIVEALVQGWTFPAENGGSLLPAGIGIATLRSNPDDANALIDRAVRDCRRAWLGDVSRSEAPARVA